MSSQHALAPTAQQPVRDRVLLDVFTTIDDVLQGVAGLHIYMDAVQIASRGMNFQSEKVVNLLITHEWARPCKLSEFTQEMANSFEFMHCRTSLLSMVAAFEIALQRFKERLWELGRLGTTGNTYSPSDYRPLLKWAFQETKSSPCGSACMRARLPVVCGDVDNARRLRNLSLHNNNKYAQSYIDDAIVEAWVAPQFQRGHQQSIQNREPVFLVNADFLRLSCSHIEFIHMMHNTLQRKYFGVKEDYNYAKEGKGTEWYRMVSGRRDVRV